MKKVTIQSQSLLFIMLLILSNAALAQVPSPVQLIQSRVSEDQDYGFSVALENDIAVVGAFRDEDSIMLETGAAYVYQFDGTTWVEADKLEASVTSSLNWFGWAVALSGDVILSAARHGDTFTSNGGDVTVYRRSGSAWNEEDILVPADGIVGDYGFAIDVDGDVAAVGAPARAGTVASEGAVYVYRHNGSEWVEEDLLFGSDLTIQSLFGSAISIDGDRMLVSAFNANDSTSNQAGKLYIFDYDGAQWNETAELQSNRSNNIANLGVSVSLEGDWAVGGAPLDNEIQGGAGAALIYHYDGANWNFHSKLTASDGQGFFLFGSAVALSGDRLLVTADNWAPPGEGSTGKAYLFEYDAVNDVWVETEGFVPAGMSVGGSFGHAAAMQDEVMIVGAPEYDGTEDAMGSAYIYGTPQVITSNESAALTHGFTLSAPYPNPFNQVSSFTVTSDIAQPVRIVMFDVLGREVKVLFEGRLTMHTPAQFTFDAGPLTGGMYWLQVRTPQQTITRPLTLLR